jgi:catechol 2,3-dioxygenase-like lactoylglutathione lyase family enzyme
MTETHIDHAAEDVGNIVEFGHVNMRVPDQRLATLFYVMGLGLTRDPYLVVGVDNMWVNAGRCQFHLPTGPAQVVRGTIGLVLPDLAALRERLGAVATRLADTQFAWAEIWGREGREHEALEAIEVTCPWGNRLRCHAPAPRLGRVTLGMSYVALDAPPGSAAAIVRFYREVLHAVADVGEDAEGPFARIGAGLDESLVFRETDRAQPEYDGNHIQISLADFSGAHRRLAARGLVTEESSRHQYRFQDVVDPDTGDVLVTVEHEVRSMRHPLFGRALVNRNPAVSNKRYAPGHEAWAAAAGPEG